jgi:dTMP kinase
VLITFEGIDGCGKSTQIELLHELFNKKNIDCVLFREPGGVRISERVRELLLDSANEIDPVTEMLLFSSARSQLVAEKIIPALKNEKVVILDRFYDSTTAYQGYGRKSVDMEKIHLLNHIASHGITPDVTYYLALPYEEARKRRQGRGEDRMEEAGGGFFENVISGFETMAEKESRIIRISALQQPSMIHAELIEDLVSRFPQFSVLG